MPVRRRAYFLNSEHRPIGQTRELGAGCRNNAGGDIIDTKTKALHSSNFIEQRAPLPKNANVALFDSEGRRIDPEDQYEICESTLVSSSTQTDETVQKIGSTQTDETVQKIGNEGLENTEESNLPLVSSSTQTDETVQKISNEGDANKTIIFAIGLTTIILFLSCLISYYWTEDGSLYEYEGFTSLFRLFYRKPSETPPVESFSGYVHRVMQTIGSNGLAIKYW